MTFRVEVYELERIGALEEPLLVEKTLNMAVASSQGGEQAAPIPYRSDFIAHIYICMHSAHDGVVP